MSAESLVQKWSLADIRGPTLSTRRYGSHLLRSFALLSHPENPSKVLSARALWVATRVVACGAELEANVGASCVLFDEERTLSYWFLTRDSCTDILTCSTSG